MIESQIGLSVGNILTIIGGFGIVFAGFYKLLSKKFDGIDKRFETLENKFDKKFELVEKKIETLETKFGSKLDRLETKLTDFEKNTEHRLTVLEMETKSINQRLSTIESYIAPRKVYEFKEQEHEEEPKEN